MLITLQLGGIKRGDPGLSFTPKLKHSSDESQGSESDEHSIPKKMRKGHAFDQCLDARVYPSYFRRIYGGGYESYDKSSGGFKYGDEQVAPCIFPGTSHILITRNQRDLHKSLTEGRAYLIVLHFDHITLRDCTNVLSESSGTSQGKRVKK